MSAMDNWPVCELTKGLGCTIRATVDNPLAHVIYCKTL